MIAPLAFARSARIAPSSSPTSSSLADDEACLLAPPQHGEERDPQGLIAPLAFARRPMAGSARCDVRWQAAVFVEPDETTVSEDLLHPDAFRRPLLQIGGANLAAARIAPSSSPTSSLLADDEACLLAPPQHGEERDLQGLSAPLAFARSASARRGARSVSEVSPSPSWHNSAGTLQVLAQ